MAEVYGVRADLEHCLFLSGLTNAMSCHGSQCPRRPGSSRKTEEAFIDCANHLIQEDKRNHQSYDAILPLGGIRGES